VYILGTKTARDSASVEKPQLKEDRQDTLNPYETIFVIKPTLSDEEVAAIVDKFKGIIEQQGGVVVAAENWGKKKLAYDIRKERKGFYIVIHLKGTGAVIREIERNYRISEFIIKFMTLKISPKSLGQALPIREEKTFSSRGRMERNER